MPYEVRLLLVLGTLSRLGGSKERFSAVGPATSHRFEPLRRGLRLGGTVTSLLVPLGQGMAQCAEGGRVTARLREEVTRVAAY